MESRFDLYLKNYNTGATVTLRNVGPQSIDDSYSAEFGQEQVIGRSSPVFIYGGGTPHELRFSIVLHEDMLPDKDILGFADTVRALSYPVYDDGGIKPPRVQCKIGSMYSFWGICNVSITWKAPIRNGHYLVGEFSFSFTRIGSVKSSETSMHEVPLGAFAVQKGGSRI